MFERMDDCCDGAGMLELLTYVFLAGSITCLLLALHRIAAALKLSARVKALNAVGGELEADERAVLVRKIESQAARYM